MLVKIIDNLAVITTFQFLFFTVYLFNHKRGNRLSSRILATFLFANAVLVASGLVQRSGFLQGTLWFSLIGSSVDLLLGPLLFLYTKSLTTRSFALRRRDLTHSTPFILFWVFMLFALFLQSEESRSQFISAWRRMDSTLSLVFIGTVNVLIFGYVNASLSALRRFRIELSNTFSSVESLNLSWLRLVIFSFAFWWISSVTHLLSHVVLTPGTALQNWVDAASSVSIITVNLLFVNVAVYKSLKQPEIYQRPGSKQTLRKYQNSSLLTRFDRERYRQRLLEHMAGRKPYLNPSLTLSGLARELSMPYWHLSQVINASLQQNFFDFVNGFRIEEAKRLLADRKNGRRTVLEVAYEVGFNSKSAFNRAFKKHTELTPTEFQKLVRTA